MRSEIVGDFQKFGLNEMCPHISEVDVFWA